MSERLRPSSYFQRSETTFGHALVMVVVYPVAAAAITAVVFRRRDMTA